MQQTLPPSLPPKDQLSRKERGPVILAGQLEAELRRFLDGAPEPVFAAGGLEVDLLRRQVRVDGNEVHLTPTEYKLLTTLVRHAGRVVTHRQLLEAVWGAHSAADTHHVRVYMAQLRHELERDSARPKLLLTEPGVGYRLKEESM